MARFHSTGSSFSASVKLVGSPSFPTLAAKARIPGNIFVCVLTRVDCLGPAGTVSSIAFTCRRSIVSGIGTDCSASPICSFWGSLAGDSDVIGVGYSSGSLLSVGFHSLGTSLARCH